jgi:hypothetical protein
MRAIILNPEDRTITETELDGSLKTLQHIVGVLIEPVYQGLDDNHHCYVNEEGLLDNPQYFFMFTDGHQPLAGNGVILSSTDDGGEAPAPCPSTASKNASLSWICKPRNSGAGRIKRKTKGRGGVPFWTISKQGSNQ